MHSLDTSNAIVDAPSLVDTEPVAGIVIVTDDTEDLLGELAPAVVVVNVLTVTAGILVQSSFLHLPAGLVASFAAGALRCVGADGQHIVALEVTVGKWRGGMRRRR